MVAGKNNACTEKQGCLYMFDNGRGAFNYGNAYFWAFSQSVLPDGSTLAFNFGDGIGSGFHEQGRAYEDFLVYQGKLRKLDTTRLTYDPLNLMKKMKLATARDNRVFPKDECEVHFTPVGIIEEGINLSLIGFGQQVVEGTFNGVCTVEGKNVDVKDAFGHVEIFWARW